MRARKNGYYEKKTNMIVILLTTMCVGVAYGMFNPVFSMYAGSLGLSTKTAGSIIAAATFLCLFGRISVGRLCAKWNARLLVRLPLFMMLFAYLLLKVSQNLLLVVFAEILQVFGMGMSVTALSTLAVQNTAEEKLGSGVGIFNLSATLAQSLAPALGAYLAGENRYDLLFLAAAGVILGGLLLAGGIWDTQEKPQRRNISAGEKKEKERVHFSDFLCPAAFSVALLMILYSIAYSSVYSYVSLCGAERGIGNISVFFTISSVVMIFTRVCSGRLLDQKEIRIVILPGYLVMTGALIVIANAGTLPAFCVGAVLNGLGFCTVQTALQVMAVRSVPEEERGVANSTYYVGGDIGLSIGAYLAGNLAYFVGYRNMYLLMACVSVGSILFFLLLTKKNHGSRKNNA